MPSDPFEASDGSGVPGVSGMSGPARPRPSPPLRAAGAAGAAAAAVTALIFLGCMSISFGGGTTYESHGPEGVPTQEGETTVPAHGVREVYYPVPYASPPNLELRPGWHECVLAEQRPDPFRVRYPEPFTRTVSWTARGVKAAPAVAPPPAEPTGSAVLAEPTPAPPPQPAP